MPSLARKGVAVAAFAREMGVSPQAVRDRVKSGRLAEAVHDDGSLDAERARVLWFANSNPRRQQRKPGDSKPTARLKQDADEPARDEYAIKVELMEVQLDTEKLKLERLRESSIDRKDAAKVVRALMRSHRNTFVNFASRYGPEIAAECGCDERKLIAEIESRIRLALNDTANEEPPFSLYGEPVGDGEPVDE